MATRQLKAGIFLAPFHAIEEDPSLAIQRDLELAEYLDRLGYDEFWVGEHHSGGFEIIASPELFLAAAAERTQRIKLGTGVVSLPYHHPLTVANRIVQLDHQTRGRLMFGVGPGLLPSDAKMLGVPISEQRDRMIQSLDIILRLMDGEVVTADTGWCKLHEARLQLLPYSQPRPEIAVASSITPSGGKLAGRIGAGILCLAATNAAGYDNLAVNWQVANETAAQHGNVMQRSALRLAGPMHIAETREKAYENIKFGYDKYMGYMNTVNPRSKLDVGLGDGSIEALIAGGQAVVGTPDDALAQLERLWAKSGGFGVYLHLAHNWADFEATKKSYELYARYVIPAFEERNRGRAASIAYVGENAPEFMGEAVQAVMQTFEKHGRKFAA